MNKIRQIQELNKRELEAGISPNASWHTDYRDTAYIYFGGLPFELSEGDIITIFSQYGEPTYINLVRDKETGKSRGFGFLKYEDQRSTDLAVDNLSGMVITGRTISVDHTRYKLRDDGEDPGIDLTKEAEDEEEGRRKRRKVSGESDSENEEERKPRRAMIKEERELEALKRDHDEDDPMREYMIKEKEEEVSLALAKIEKKEKSGHNSSHRHWSKRDGEDHERHSKRRDRSKDAHHERDGRSRRRSRSTDGWDEGERLKRRDRSPEAKDLDRRSRRVRPERASRRRRSTEERSDDDERVRSGGERRGLYSDDRDDDRPRKSRHGDTGRSRKDYSSRSELFRDQIQVRHRSSIPEH